ncbi:MAG: class I SAM-dependent methyltransferase [Promethearchaeota archaeon]|jgi:ubiquinone/menaquinone biosynthesis C-methylase UbiE
MHFYEPADPQPCYYCKTIKKYEDDYPIREGIFTNEKIIFRCAWHAKFQCSECGKFYHFSWLYYCPNTEQLICGDCKVPSLKPVRFWNKSYAYTFWCKNCEESHYDLMFEEYLGNHPWQLKKRKIVSNIEEDEPWKPNWEPSHSRKGKEITLEEALTVEDRITSMRKHIWGDLVTRSDFKPISAVKKDEALKGWELNSNYWIEALDKHLYLGGEMQKILVSHGDDGGDINRQFILDPALWEIIGEVTDLKVLDAGCGNGYLTRNLAKKGAKAVGIDFSQTFIEYCKKKEENEKLGCEFIQASLVDLSKIESNIFDLVVANVVMVDIPDYKQAFKEIGRVIKPKGRFIWSNTHPIFARHSALELKLPSDTRRREERMYKIIDKYSESGGIQVKWFGVIPTWQFDRTLSEYSKGLKEAGFVICEIIEPKASIETMQMYPAVFAFDSDRFPTFIIFDCLKT